MDRKIQEILFENSVDMDILTEKAKILADSIKEAGNPKRTIIQIRKADEFDNRLSPEEVIEQIDREISQVNHLSPIDLLRVWQQNDYYLVVGVKL